MPIDIASMIEADPLADEKERPGPLGRLIRRLVLPALATYFQQQRDIEYALVMNLEELEQKVNTYFDAHVDPFEVEERFQAHDRARLEVIQALEQLRAKLDRELRQRSQIFDNADVIADVAEASRALPYMEGDPLARFEAPHVGEVIGYRAGTDGAAAEFPYREFESVFRGSEERIAHTQRPYLDLLAGQAPVLDVGCGRGEMLDLLGEAGIDAIGVDLDPGMVERCREKGHDVTLGDAVGFLEDRDVDSLGTVFSAQLIEHLPRPELERFVELAHDKLRGGGLFVAETVNPHCARALKAFWLDLTHQHPIFPEVALMLCRIAGFPEAYVFHPMGSGDASHDRFTQDAYAVVATKAA
jgi:SAM-dependent methyltransferase